MVALAAPWIMNPENVWIQKANMELGVELGLGVAMLCRMKSGFLDLKLIQRLKQHDLWW